IAPPIASAMPARTRIAFIAEPNWLRLPLRGAALECLERPEFRPRLPIARGGVEAEVITPDDSLSDSNVDRASFDAGRPAIAPVAEVALRECVCDGVIRDASGLLQRELVRRLRFGGDRE